MRLQERDNPVLVLGLQHRAGDVDDPAARLDVTRRRLQGLDLILDPLLQRAGAHPPLGVGTAPPGARAAARRVDEDEVATPRQVGEDVRRRAGARTCTLRAPERSSRPKIGASRRPSVSVA